MISIESQKLIENLLVQTGAMTQQALGELKLQAIQQGKPLMSYIYDKHLVEEEQLTKILAQAAGVPYVNLKTVNPPPEALKQVTKELAKSYMAVPFGNIKGKLALAMLDASNVQAIDFLTKQTGQSISVFMASRSSIESVLGKYPEDKPLVQPKDIPARIDTAQIQNLVKNAPVTSALNTILDYAIKIHASDIHIEPRENEVQIRCRIDGILQETMKLPKTLEPALVSRVKILTNLKIDEHRVPQDGQFTYEGAGKKVDARVAVSPVVHGEQVVIRLLDVGSFDINLNSLGLRGKSYDIVKAGIRKPYGMTLSTGPTGSGKTTTLYAVIKELNDQTLNIVTLEDPVEYRIDDINQIQVNNAVGLTFANGLRSILRQDPNVIMVGEIRDKETADLAVQAALTGHIVLSSLHTNSASGVLPRMLDMNIEPFLLASTINTVVGQRLVRKLCQKCKVEFKSNEAQTLAINNVLGEVLKITKASAKVSQSDYANLPGYNQTAYTLYKAKGCHDCINGYSGRMGIFEVFGMNNAIEQLLVKRATSSDIHKQSVADGMLTMKQDGYLKALAGETTLEEVSRVAADI